MVEVQLIAMDDVHPCDPIRLIEPEAIGALGLRNSIRPFVAADFAVRKWEMRSVFKADSIAVLSTADVAANSAGVRSSSRVRPVVVVVAPPEMELPPYVGQVEGEC